MLSALAISFGCSSAPPGVAVPAPTPQDALRTAQAATDDLLNLDRPFVKLGVLTQHPYVCATSDPCSPREGYVNREVNLQGVTHAQIAKFFVDNVGNYAWKLENVFCDESKNEFVVVASKLTDDVRSYPGRFELLNGDKTEMRITVPAVGAENQFTTLPAGATYPTGTCNPTLQAAVDRVKKTPATRPPGTAKGTSTTTAAP